MTMGARAVVYDEETRSVFLVRHTYVNGWHLPGGGIEVGETAEEALERELSEEGNIAIDGRPELKSLHLNSTASRRDHVAVYLVTRFAQERPRAPDGEIAEARFFPLAALPAEATQPTLRRLAEIFDGAEVSPEW